MHGLASGYTLLSIFCFFNFEFLIEKLHFSRRLLSGQSNSVAGTNDRLPLEPGMVFAKSMISTSDCTKPFNAAKATC